MLVRDDFPLINLTVIAQESHYPPGNHHASHFQKMSYFQVITTMLTTRTDDPSLVGARAIIKVSGHQYRWSAGGYDMEIRHC